MGVPHLCSLTFLQTTMGSSVWETAVVPEISHLTVLNTKKELCWMQKKVRDDCSALHFRGRGNKGT